MCEHLLQEYKYRITSGVMLITLHDASVEYVNYGDAYCVVEIPEVLFSAIPLSQLSIRSGRMPI